MLRPLTFCACLCAAAMAQANPTIEENWNTYPVDGATASEIHGQMHGRGPDGYWAYADWNVEWSDACDVHVTINYQMPRHENPEVMDEKLRLSWERMIKVLGGHEEQHGKHGIAAAEEIAEADCEGANAIISKWAEADRQYDEDTDHGLTEGVFFPDEADPNARKVSAGGQGEDLPLQSETKAQPQTCENAGGNAEENFPLCGSDLSLSSDQRQEGLTTDKTTGGRSENR